MVSDMTLWEAPNLPCNQGTVVVDNQSMAMLIMQFTMKQLDLVGDKEIHHDLLCVVCLPVIFIAIVFLVICFNFACCVVKPILTKTTTTLTF